MDAEGTWAGAELGLTKLGDARRTARLVQFAQALAARPRASLPGAVEGGLPLLRQRGPGSGGAGGGP
jgi:hypothetical protein